ncbi:hypothetical protein FE257_003780 [Aspergillus nanangensis]|uniref:Methyltransferase domain-containing protein n=1 Tax=Aspergillus nanangensis TaxID=2582783 RepID=A0AAD4GMN9_ASPNN|nr:hypothetical protein FE257_003780 [Aspergillus nanangensis]
MVGLSGKEAKPQSNPGAINASFGLADGHGYMLETNSYQAAGRLNLQHYLWRETFGFSIHPSIKLPETPNIVDVACGTGLWLIDVAREISTAQLEGLDTDLTRAPHTNWLPSNIHMRHWNMFEDVPPELEGKFDLVHIRLLVLVLSNVEIHKPLANFLKLVKPGGYIQWDDVDCINIHVKKADGSLDASALEELRVACYSNGRHNWIMDLPQLLTSKGFQLSKLHWYDERMELVRAFNDQHLMTMEEFADQLMRTGQQAGAARFRHLIAHSYEECLRGAALSMPRIVVVGQRPDTV